MRHHGTRLSDRQNPRGIPCSLPRSPDCFIRFSTFAPRTTTPASHDDLSDDYERITRYYVSQLAYLAGRLESMREGEGTVLDNSLSPVAVQHVVRKPPRQHATPAVDRRGLGGAPQTGWVF